MMTAFLQVQSGIISKWALQPHFSDPGDFMEQVLQTSFGAQTEVPILCQLFDAVPGLKQNVRCVTSQ